MAMVLSGVKSYSFSGAGSERRLTNKMENILLNGSHICMVVPGDDEPTPKAVNEDDFDE